MLSTRFSAPEGSLTNLFHRCLLAGLTLACTLGASAEAAASADAPAPRTNVATTPAVSADLSVFAHQTPGVFAQETLGVFAQETFAIQVAGRFSGAAALADQYLRRFQNNVRDGAKYKANKHWNLYVKYAKRAGQGVQSRGFLEQQAKNGKKASTSGASASASKPLSSSTAKGGAPSNWDYVLRNGGDLKKASPYIRSVAASMFRDAVGSGASLNVGYLAPNYMGYSKPSGGKYIRHTGLDLPRGVGTPVRALAPGKVVSVITKNPLDAAVIVKENGADRYWAYGHVQAKVGRNQNVGKGTVLGGIINPRGRFRPHLHVSVLTTPFPVGGSLKNKLGWGRTKGGSPKEAEGTALRYTMQPLEAYARANGMLK